MVSHPKLGSDPPIGSDRESGCDIVCYNDITNGPIVSIPTYIRVCDGHYQNVRINRYISERKN